MHASIHRRITFAKCWATTRIALLDVQERYEDSFAISEEFREWITCIDEHPEHLEDSVLKFPSTFRLKDKEHIRDQDEMLEI